MQTPVSPAVAIELDAGWTKQPRASRPSGTALQDYQALLKDSLIRPGKLQLYIMNLDTRTPLQLTDNGAANFGPYWHPDGRHIIFVVQNARPRGPQL